MPLFEFQSEYFKDPFVNARQYPGIYLRPAVITKVDPAKGSVDIAWLDHPCIRQDVPITLSGQGFFELPTIGSKVLVGFDKGYSAYIVKYIQPGYRDLVGTSRDNTSIVPTIWAMRPGEKMLLSYLYKYSDTKESVPQPTGTYFYMNNVGNILMTTAEGDYWLLDRQENIIEQQSMNNRVITEAGILDFGLVKRNINNKSRIISSTGIPLEDPTGNTPSLTEFRLRLLETADANPNTAPEVTNPFIELTLGTKINDDSGLNNKIVLTDLSHAVSNKEIMIQLKTKADQGFEFTVDKDGNLTLKVKGNVRVDVQGDSNITVNGSANLTSKNIVAKAEDIKIAGNNNEQPVVLKKFLRSYYNLHQHTVPPGGGPTSGVTVGIAPLKPGDDISDISKVG